MSFEEMYINAMVDELSISSWRDGAKWRAGSRILHVEGATRDDAIDRFKEILRKKLFELPFPLVDVYLQNITQ